MATLLDNKQAHYRYNILETWEAGIALSGQEVKSIKSGHGDLKGSYVRVRGARGKIGGREKLVAELVNLYIPSYLKAGPMFDYEPRHTRKLLLKKYEMLKLFGLLNTKGLTLVPIKVYTRNHLVKLLIGLGKGKTTVDRRDTIKKREVNREMRRRMMRGPSSK